MVVDMGKVLGPPNKAPNHSDSEAKGDGKKPGDEGAGDEI